MAVNMKLDSAAVIEKFESMIENAPDMSEKIATQLGDIVLQEAKSNVPVDSGDLRDSLELEVVGSGAGTIVEVGSSIDYAPYVEYGTSRARPQPFLMPAAKVASGKAEEIAKVVLKENG